MKVLQQIQRNYRFFLHSFFSWAERISCIFNFIRTWLCSFVYLFESIGIINVQQRSNEHSISSPLNFIDVEYRSNSVRGFNTANLLDACVATTTSNQCVMISFTLDGSSRSAHTLFSGDHSTKIMLQRSCSISDARNSNVWYQSHLQYVSTSCHTSTNCVCVCVCVEWMCIWTPQVLAVNVCGHRLDVG